MSNAEVSSRYRFVFTFLTLITLGTVQSQTNVLPLNGESSYSYEKYFYLQYGTLDPNFKVGMKKGQSPKTQKRDTEKHTTYLNLHSQVKPYIQSELTPLVNFDSLIFQSPLHLGYPFKKDIASKIKIAPLGEIAWRNDNQFNWGGGVSAAYQLHPKFSVNGFYRFAQAPNWSYINTNHNIGQAIVGLGMKGDSSNPNQLNHFEAYASFTPNNYFSFLLGHGKNFWGDGYRSLLLSDNAAAYPFLRINSTFWKVRYTNLWALHKDHRYENYQGIQNKFIVAHQISWNIIKNLNFSVFETIIWQGKDTMNHRNFEPNYLNPIIFFRPVEYSIGSSDNAMLGATLKYVIKEKWIAYGQLLLDEFYLKEIRARNGWWANKYGIQLGIKSYDLFGIENLSFLAEYNVVRPFTYSHVTSLQNYAHNDQSLAHPLGSNFKEGVMWLRYSLGNFYFHSRSIYAEKGEDFANSTVSYGGDMFRSYTRRSGEYNHTNGQGNKRYVFMQEMRVSYLLSGHQNLRIFGSYMLRKDRNNFLSRIDHFFQIGISCNLWNTYTDL
jgi:hypothetical protein